MTYPVYDPLNQPVWAHLHSNSLRIQYSVFLLMLKWRKLLRNHFRMLPKNLAARTCGIAKPKKTGCVSCAGKKRNKRWSFPHWWLISRYTHISSLFPTRQARRKGISLAGGWWHAGGVEKREALSLPAPVCQCVGWECPVFLHLYLWGFKHTMLPWDFNRRRMWTIRSLFGAGGGWKEEQCADQILVWH